MTVRKIFGDKKKTREEERYLPLKSRPPRDRLFTVRTEQARAVGQERTGSEVKKFHVVNSNFEERRQNAPEKTEGQPRGWLEIQN